MEIEISSGIVFFALTKILLTSLKNILYSLKPKRLKVLYRSDNFLVVSKAHDLLINTNNPDIKETLQTQLLQYCPAIADSRLTHQFHFVHRLDFVTSGALCIALHRSAAKAAGDAFENREAKKYYVALARGWVKGDKLSIEHPIGEDSCELMTSRKMCVKGHPNCIRPRDALTRLLVLQRGVYNGYPATKCIPAQKIDLFYVLCTNCTGFVIDRKTTVLLHPVTGRRHQLRVHLSHLGHTVVGDYTYSQRKDVDPPRTFLHSLRLMLPTRLEILDIRTPDPFRKILGWRPTQLVHHLDKRAFVLLDQEISE